VGGAREARRDSHLEGERDAAIKQAESEKQQQINKAECVAAAILTIAQATVAGLRKVAKTNQVL
jgi:hypothetical protein